VGAVWWAMTSRLSSYAPEQIGTPASQPAAAAYDYSTRIYYMLCAKKGSKCSIHP
jgi:hypothetical protein